MYSHATKFGELKSISLFNTYSNRQLKDCVLSEKNELITPFGSLTPQYEHAGMRRKHTYSVSLFPNGNLKRVALHDQTEVETPIGSFPAELITFYENGNIKKIFPLNGQISAYWDEDDEYNLAKEFSFEFPFGSFTTKTIGIGFYENGTVQSLTLWPKEIITIDTPIGKQRVRIGFSLYPDGSIKSFEPIRPINVLTPIGLINCFDVNASGISGDKNSLIFNEDGSIKSLITSNTRIIAAGPNNTTKVHSPMHTREAYDLDIFFQPLKIEFEKDMVRFNRQYEYKIEDSRFIAEPYAIPIHNKCSDCSSCAKCTSVQFQLV
jgi:hypothetical protein